MIEKEAVAPRGAAARRRRDLQPAADRMPLGIDATIRYGLDVPGTESLTSPQLESDNPYNTRNRPGCRRRRSRIPGSPRCRRPRTPRRSTTSTSSASRTSVASLLHRERVGVLPEVLRVRIRRLLTCVDRAVRHGSSGCSADPVEHSLSPRDAERRVRGARARLGVRRRCRSRRSGSRRRCAASSRSASPGANVTTPHKRAVAALCDEPSAPSVNTLVIRDGRVEGSITDAAILDGLDGRARRRSSATAGAAAAFAQRAAGARASVLARGEPGRPDVARRRPRRQRDLANATRSLVELARRARRSSTSRTRRRRRRAAARARRCDASSTGSRCSSPGRGRRSSSGRACPRRSRSCARRRRLCRA